VVSRWAGVYRVKSRERPTRVKEVVARFGGSVSQVERDENHVLEINGIEVAISAFETLP
jgi:hypothetical protein